MILRLLRQLANKQWVLVILAWIAVAAVLRIAAPEWKDVVYEGDLEHLPADAPSAQANRLLRRAFPDNSVKSEVVLIFARENEILSVADRQFILDLAFEIEGKQDRPDGIGEAPETKESSASNKTPGRGSLLRLPIVEVWHAKTKLVNKMLLSSDERAEMIVVRLSNPLMAVDNIRVRDQLLDLLEARMPAAPPGMEFGVTGSAAIGGDTFAATRDSLTSTQWTTLLLVLACLVMIYRSPMLVLVPLATIGLSVFVSTSLVALLAQNFGPETFGGAGLKIFTTTKVFVVVILFGAGTDYCLFLIARYREELSRGVAQHRAPGIALRNVSGALSGSAFTTILGLGVMAFADYGKFASSGPVIAVCLFVALLACVTFAPALLRALGPLLFWPIESRATSSPDGPASRLWSRVADVVIARPLTILLACLAISAPLVVAGWNVPLNYDLLSELPKDSPSLRGTRIVARHFGQGWLAPMKVVVHIPDAKLNSADTRFDVALLHNALFELPSVQDVRSPSLPTGGDPKHRRRFSYEGIYSAAAAGSPLAIDTFVSEAAPYEGQVMQLSVILADDPFSKDARRSLEGIRVRLAQISQQATLSGQPNPWRGAQFSLAGATPGMEDLSHVTASDQRRIQVLCVSVVLLVLLVLLRRPLACLYLIATVLLSYWVTIGATEQVFQYIYGASFQGLDWKLPLFLFVILVAVGQDYNIYLTTRILEEQRHGEQIEGLRRAIQQTGGIITSCGIIMAGTFVSMMSGTLRGMVELGFALALGVLLDTFVVRTILVPCYFALRGR